MKLLRDIRKLKQQARALTPEATDDTDLQRVVDLMRATVPPDPSPEAEQRARDAAAQLGRSWVPFHYHPQQCAMFYSPARYRAAEAGRGGGKSGARRKEIVIAALTPGWPLSEKHIVVGARTQAQTERLYWRHIVRMIPPQFIASVRRSERQIETVTGAVIHVLGFDAPERAEGLDIDDLFVDEFADMKPEAWFEHLYGCVDRAGRPPSRVTFCGTGDLRVGEHFATLCDEWRDLAEQGDTRYAYFNWPSRGIVSEEKWLDAQRRLPPAVFTVEFEAGRASTGNLIYNEFDRDVHCVRGLRLLPHRPVVLCFDWNWDPGNCVILQEQCVEDYTTDVPLPEDIADEFTAVVGEVFIEQSSTPQVLRSVLAWLEEKQHRGAVRCYGDPAGGAQGSAKAGDTDIVLIRKVLGPHLDERLSLHFKRSAPPVVARVNTVNLRLRAAGDRLVRLVVDPDEAPELVKDFRLVKRKDGAKALEIDKPNKGEGRLRSHVSDAVGYYLTAEFPARGVGKLRDADY